MTGLSFSVSNLLLSTCEKTGWKLMLDISSEGSSVCFQFLNLLFQIWCKQKVKNVAVPLQESCRMEQFPVTLLFNKVGFYTLTIEATSQTNVDDNS